MQFIDVVVKSYLSLSSVFVFLFAFYLGKRLSGEQLLIHGQGIYLKEHTSILIMESHKRLCPPHLPGLESGAVFCFVFSFMVFVSVLLCLLLLLCVSFDSLLDSNP